MRTLSAAAIKEGAAAEKQLQAARAAADKAVRNEEGEALYGEGCRGMRDGPTAASRMLLDKGEEGSCLTLAQAAL